MRRVRRLGTRLLLANFVVIVVGGATLFLTVDLVAPGAFDAAMGHAMNGTGGMDEMMGGLVRAAFQDAVRTSLLLAVLAASVSAVVVSLALSTRLSKPISRLAQASRRIAAGRYAERVQMTSEDEIGELARSFNLMAASLETTERRRLELVGDVAHELRTPLATLDGYLEGLEDGVIQPREETWTLLRRETARMARLVNDLQELWRAEAKQLPLTIEPVDVGAVAAAAADRFSALASERAVELRLDTPPAPSALADRERLAQVLDNLLSNAVRYTAEGTTITIGVQGDREWVTLSVADQGPGLTEEQLAKVFERFYRIDPSRSRALGGSGIGLAIAKALVGLMDGRIWAESEGLERGATFRVALPRVA
ncbi:MAG: HAMP domain-containing protein [Chloroflexi bacterium]|nr:HAMP domain-containing protein [Chloroflexota bacterium]